MEVQPLYVSLLVFVSCLKKSCSHTTKIEQLLRAIYREAWSRNGLYETVRDITVEDPSPEFKLLRVIFFLIPGGNSDAYFCLAHG